MERVTYRQIKNSTQTRHFSMNEVACLVFQQGKKRFLLTDGLNACFAIFVVSTLAVIGAHIPPHPGSNFHDANAGDKNLLQKVREIGDLYKEYEKFFPKNKAFLIFATIHGKVPLPDKKAFLEKVLKKFSIDLVIQDYEVKVPGEPRRDEHGTAFVDGGNTEGILVVLQDRVIHRTIRESSTSTPRATIQTPSSDRYSNPIFERDATPNSQYTEFRYTKSVPNEKEHGAKIVETAQGRVSIKAEHWIKDRIRGKMWWVCRKYKMYTDI